MVSIGPHEDISGAPADLALLLFRAFRPCSGLFSHLWLQGRAATCCQLHLWLAAFGGLTFFGCVVRVLLIQLVGVQPHVSTVALLGSVWHPEVTSGGVTVTSETVVAEQQLRDSEAEQALTAWILCAIKPTLRQQRAQVCADLDKNFICLHRECPNFGKSQLPCLWMHVFSCWVSPFPGAAALSHSCSRSKAIRHCGCQQGSRALICEYLNKILCSLSHCLNCGQIGWQEERGKHRKPAEVFLVEGSKAGFGWKKEAQAGGPCSSGTYGKLRPRDWSWSVSGRPLLVKEGVE